MANILAAQAGNYSNPATWVGGVVPTTGDIACSGTFRINLDMSPLAQLSDANLDWVAGGGAALGSAYTGGFDIPDGATITIPVFRHSFTRSNSFATNNGLSMSNGNITITETIWVEGAVVRACIKVAPTTTLVLNVGTTKLSPTHNTSASWCLFDITYGASANVTMTFGDIIPASGTSVGMPIFRTNTIVPTHLDITFTGKIFTRGSSQYTVDHTGFNSNAPIGTSRCRFLSNEIGIGAGIGSIISLRWFKEVIFEDLSLLKDSLSASSAAFSCTDIASSILINSDLTSNGTCALVFAGAASLTIDGSVSRVHKAGVAVSNVSLQTHSLGGNIVINGDAVIDSTANPQPGATYALISIGLSNVTLDNIILTSGVSPCINMYSSAPGKTLTVSGNIDCSGVAVTNITNTGTSAGILCNTAIGHHVVVVGDVRGFNSVNSTATFNGIATVKSAAILVGGVEGGLQSLTVGGSVVAGRASPGFLTEGLVDFPITVRKVVSGVKLLSTSLAPPAMQTVFQSITVDELDFGAEGRFPINGYMRFRNAAPAVVTGINVDGSPCVLAEQGDGLAVLAANVRNGVAIGSTTGTLVVPAANTVLDGIVYDNGTVGTLHTTENVVIDLSALETAVGTIKAKTDLLTFGTTGVVTEGGGSSNAPDYTLRFDALDTAVAAIPTLTYASRFNEVDSALGNLIANNMRNNLVAGIVGSTNFIGLWNDSSIELTGGTPAYQRQAVVWSTPFNGIVTNTTDITINVAAGSTVAYIAGFTLVTGGTAQFSYACAEVDAVTQSVYTIPAGTLQMSTTVQ